jgi:thioredoxin reductase
MSKFDAIIVGGGPAGASCALWLHQLGFLPCIVERRGKLGGLQNESPYLNDWIAPVVGMRGEEVAHGMHVNILSHGIECRLDTSVRSVAIAKGGFDVTVDHETKSDILSAPFVVLASGVRPADGALRPSADLIIGPGKRIDEREFRGKTVAILGGGDNAFENYGFIRAKGAASVRLYARTLRARRELLERVPAHDVSVGAYEVDAHRMLVASQRYDVIVVLYGWTPSLDFVRGLDIARDASGFVITEQSTAETSIRNVFAIGEVAHRMHPCCVTSMADGVVAAKEIQRRMEARARDTFVAAAYAAFSHGAGSVGFRTSAG